MPPSPPPSPIRKNIIIGLSGPSSAGKTTLARLLRSVFNIPASPETNHNSISLFILHEDDFYKPDNEIPITTTPYTRRQLQDWDCADSLNLPLLESTLQYIHAHGSLPPDLQSKEDQNPVPESGVSETELETHRQGVIDTLKTCPRSNVEVRLCVLEGFLLYPDPSPSQHPPAIPRSITELLDVKLFLRSTFALTKSRRESRAGYVTLDGFWTDPEGYVDEVVWPRYVEAHGWMFVGGHVEGELKREVKEGFGGGIEVGPGRGNVGFKRREGENGEGEDGLLGWAVGVLEGGVGRVLKEEARKGS